MTDDRLSPDHVKAITDAVLRELVIGVFWNEIAGKTLADLCAINQDALIDDLYEGHPDDTEHRAGMLDHIKTYDALLGTNRFDELPPEWSTPEAPPQQYLCALCQTPHTVISRDEALKVVRATGAAYPDAEDGSGIYSDDEAASLLDMLPEADSASFISTSQGFLRWDTELNGYIVEPEEDCGRVG